MQLKLSFVSLSLSALLMVSVLTVIATTTTQVYAQSQQGQGRGPCPEGFELNRGVCQAEPEVSCDFLLEQGFPPIRISQEEDQCRISHYSLPLCEEGTYDWWHNQCEDPVGFEANFPTENQNIYCDGDRELQFVDVDWVCVEYTYVPAEVEECEVGTFNEARGMCEVKPGNRGSNRA
jgi:hypothetical protein